MKKWLFILLLSSTAKANVCGSDFQNFNPTTNGLDFVTVQSSETLSPCVLNFGLFFNYAANTLSYWSTFNGVEYNSKPGDRIFAADISLGTGINNYWDFGINIPFMLSQELDQPSAVTAFSRKGANEIKINTKYRFKEYKGGGLAAILSMNNNLIENNPFAGEGAGPTYNFEIAADKSFGLWATAINIGYRKRTPGTQIAGQPFLPFKDQYIYSVAGSYFFEPQKTKLILELFGSSAAKQIDYSSDRSLNSLEALAGIKYDLNPNVALHFGGSTKVGDTYGGPDWRVYAGINWVLGPYCEKSWIEKISSDGESETYRLNVEVLFDTNSDQLKTNYLTHLNKFSEEMKRRGFSKMQIEGHTDSIGDANYNLDLSERRARSVKNYMVNTYGLAGSKITTIGFGEIKPIANNANFQGRQKNRRVEFKVWK
jgi:outer membrane protein OmpA-like peptidoglycan-associated protein